MARRDDDPDTLGETAPSGVTSELGTELLEALSRLAAGDFSARAGRTQSGDGRDTAACLINEIAQQSARILRESEQSARRLHDGVETINELFLALARGDFTVRVERDESGDPLDVLAFFFNTTAEELEAQFEAQSQQRAVLRSILDAIADGVVMVGPSGEVAETNDAARTMLGRPLPPMTNFLKIISERDRARIGDVLTLEAPPFAGKDIAFELPDGNTINLVVTTSPLPESTTGGGWVLTLRDERELRNARAQLQAADRMATMGTLAAGVAHEINNPMSFLLSNVEFAIEELEANEPGTPLSQELQHELVEALTAAQDGGQRVTRIVRDLKSISRVDEESTSPVKVHDVLDASLSMLRREIRSRARVERVYAKLPAVHINEARVVQVCLNLLQNAAHAIPVGNADENVIRVETSMADTGEVQIAIVDTGTGIPADEIDSIFAPFVSSKAPGQGTGLGLAICKRLVDGMGGRIEVESTLGRGTTFRVFLPTQPASPGPTDRA